MSSTADPSFQQKLSSAGNDNSEWAQNNSSQLQLLQTSSTSAVPVTPPPAPYFPHLNYGVNQRKKKSFMKAVADGVKSTIQEILIMFLEVLALIVLPALFLMTSPKCLTRYLCVQ